MSHPLAYIITGALMECDKGAAIKPFKTNPRTTTVGGIVAANESDKVPLLNIPSFVMCKAGGKCVPIPTPAPGTGHPAGGGSVWHDTGTEFSTVAGLPPVLFRSCVKCAKGGKVTFLTSGQIPMSEMDPSGELQDQIDAINEQADEMEQDYERAENAVGESGLLEGFIPVWGSGRDAVNSAQQGDWGWAAFHTGMVALDVATLGIGSIVKGGIKGGVKGVAKATVKELAEGMAKKMATLAAAKAVAKEAIEKGLKETAERLAKIGARKIVTACFPAGTPVAVKGGFKNIEDVEIGDLVWSHNPDTGETGLKKVVDTHVSIADDTIQLTIGEEVIETTANHPFYTEQGWKDAQHLDTGDKIRSKNGRWEQIKSISFSNISKKVYNFTVRDWHTYFVGAWEWLVHNACGLITTTARQLQKKFKHAIDFGVTGNYSKANAQSFVQAINDHIDSPAVTAITGTYRGDAVIHYLDPNTGLNVIADMNNNFVSGWKLSQNQLQNVLSHGGLGGG